MKPKCFVCDDVAKVSCKDCKHVFCSKECASKRYTIGGLFEESTPHLVIASMLKELPFTELWRLCSVNTRVRNYCRDEMFKEAYAGARDRQEITAGMRQMLERGQFQTFDEWIGPVMAAGTYDADPVMFEFELQDASLDIARLSVGYAYMYDDRFNRDTVEVRYAALMQKTVKGVLDAFEYAIDLFDTGQGSINGEMFNFQYDQNDFYLKITNESYNDDHPNYNVYDGVYDTPFSEEIRKLYPGDTIRISINRLFMEKFENNYIFEWDPTDIRPVFQVYAARQWENTGQYTIELWAESSYINEIEEFIPDYWVSVATGQPIDQERYRIKNEEYDEDDVIEMSRQNLLECITFEERDDDKVCTIFRLAN